MAEQMFVCGAGGAPDDALRVLVGLTTCCVGAVERGPSECTCWEIDYDLEQQPPQPGAPGTRSTMCADCAYRPDSPERSGDEDYVHDFDTFDAGTFFCHQGMRKPVRFRHPLGITIDATGDFYKPPLRLDRDRDEAVPYKADGSPGDRCAGWAAHRRRADETVAELALELAEDTDA